MKFYDEIETMLKTPNFVPSYPRIIVDMWDFNSKLGERLLNLYDMYKKV